MTVIEQLEVLEVRQLGESIGYGHLMALAHELWALDLESKGMPRSGAHVPVSIVMVKDEYQKDALNDPVYTSFVERALTEMSVVADKGVLEKINEKQDSLRATCKAWDEAIEKDGYVN